MTKLCSIECKPSVRILRYTSDAPLIIASASKLTLSSKPMDSIIEKMDKNSMNSWIKELIRRRHGSPLEHSLYSFEVTCSRVASHQIIRHRIASYTQLSQRRGDKLLRNVVIYLSKLLGKEVPSKPRKPKDYEVYASLLNEVISKYRVIGVEELVKAICKGFIIPPKACGEEQFLKNILVNLREYYSMLSKGYSFEDARFILPQAVKTRLFISMNARELIENFLPLRMCSHAQWEIRYIAWSLWRELVNIHPELFSLTGPRCVFLENNVRSTPCTLQHYLNGECEFTITRCPELVPRTGIRNCLLYASKDPWEDAI